jgi:hypothetical protein
MGRSPRIMDKEKPPYNVEGYDFADYGINCEFMEWEICEGRDSRGIASYAPTIILFPIT